MRLTGRGVGVLGCFVGGFAAGHLRVPCWQPTKMMRLPRACSVVASVGEASVGDWWCLPPICGSLCHTNNHEGAAASDKQAEVKCLSCSVCCLCCLRLLSVQTQAMLCCEQLRSGVTVPGTTCCCRVYAFRVGSHGFSRGGVLVTRSPSCFAGVAQAPWHLLHLSTGLSCQWGVVGRAFLCMAVYRLTRCACSCLVGHPAANTCATQQLGYACSSSRFACSSSR